MGAVVLRADGSGRRARDYVDDGDFSRTTMTMTMMTTVAAAPRYEIRDAECDSSARMMHKDDGDVDSENVAALRRRAPLFSRCSRDEVAESP